MEQIGFSLIDGKGKELQHWGDTRGQCAGAPSFIRLSNGDDVHCPNIGEEYSGYRLVPRFLASSDHDEIEYADDCIIVHRPDPLPETVEQKLGRVGLSIADIREALAPRAVN